jgi:hypothetical protein
MVKIASVIKYIDAMPFNYQGLRDALTDLDELIGMENIKSKIAGILPT